MENTNSYESQELLNQYLLFHYGDASVQLPFAEGPQSALNYPERCIAEILDPQTLPEKSRALDLGCSVGRSSFELAKHCGTVVGLDYSQSFIDAANNLLDGKTLCIPVCEEGMQKSIAEISAPSCDVSDRIFFEQGDACKLADDLGRFDVVLMANLIDRLYEPEACLRQLAGLCNPGAQLIITSPYTWSEEYTPKEHWLSQEDQSTLEGLTHSLTPDFCLRETKQLPFIIREHRRKYQWSVAEASVWVRN